MIAFDVNMANDWRQLLQKLAQNFEECEYRLRTALNGLNIEITSRSDMENRLGYLHNRAKQIRENIDLVANLLSQAETTYVGADRQTAELVRSLVEQWCTTERIYAPVLSRANYGLTVTDVEKIDATRDLDGLFIPGLQMNSENRTAYFKPLNVKFEILPDGD
ncbi:MAG: hypothetical protein FWF80_03540 [Defluviitaleaceae bacterium]|nr:hypothetical protein [Defluviitaleaceae bacterium]